MTRNEPTDVMMPQIENSMEAGMSSTYRIKAMREMSISSPIFSTTLTCHIITPTAKFMGILSNVMTAALVSSGIASAFNEEMEG